MESMGDRYSKKALVFTAVGFFLGGLVVGSLLTRTFSLPMSPPALLPLSAQLEEALRRDPSYAHALWDKGLALRAKGDDAGAIKAWEAFVRLFPADSSDVVEVKKWIAEAQARLASASSNPEGSAKKLLLKKPPKGLLEGQSSK